MKPFVRATVIFTLGLVLAIVVSGADDSNADASSPKEVDNEEETIKVYKRLIPADVLRGKSFIDKFAIIRLFAQKLALMKNVENSSETIFLPSFPLAEYFSPNSYCTNTHFSNAIE